MKKLWLCFNLFATTLLFSESLIDNYISKEKNLLFNYEEEINRLDSATLKKSWINPIAISYIDSINTQPLDKDTHYKAFSISINQPIFKSGGIYYAIKFANINESLNHTQIEIKKRALITQAVEILFKLKKLKLQKEQLYLQIKNDNIDIARKKEQYIAGIIDSSFLNQAILQRNRDKTRLFGLELEESSLRSAFKTLSDKNPDTLKLPKLKLIHHKDYIEGNLELSAQRLLVSKSEYASKIALSRYLPSISIDASYYNTDTNRPLIGMRDNYYQYGFRITIPLNINAPQDIEAKRVAFLRSAVALSDKKREVESQYSMILKTLEIIDKKIALAKSDAKLYKRLLRDTIEQAKAGTKTNMDIETMRNSMNISKLDAKIYKIERQIQLLKLYEKFKR